MHHSERLRDDGDAERVKIVEFADLPKYGSGRSRTYFPGAIATGAGQDVVVGIATSGRAKHTYYAASSYFGYQDIALGPDGALRLTEQAAGGARSDV